MMIGAVKSHSACGDGANLALTWLTGSTYDFGIGVSPGTMYAVRRIDSDYFREE